MMTDGTYLYVGEDLDFHDVNVKLKKPIGAENDEEEIAGYVHVLDRELTEVAKVKICTKGLMDFYENFSIKILDNTVYLQSVHTVYGCPLQKFLEGEPVFIPVYDHVIEINPGTVWQ